MASHASKPSIELAIAAQQQDLLCEPTPMYLADFPIGSAQLEMLKKRFKHPKAAILLQHLEFLNRKYGMPVDGVYRNLYPCGNVPSKKTISGHLDIASRRILFPILSEIRVSYSFERGVRLIPSEIDFQGKLYASYYLRSKANRTLLWYRNASLIDELVAEIKEELLKQQAKNPRLCNFSSVNIPERFHWDDEISLSS